MKHFIKLMSTYSETEFYLNPKQIEKLKLVEKGTVTEITAFGGINYYVNETPEQIDELISQLDQKQITKPEIILLSKMVGISEKEVENIIKYIKETSEVTENELLIQFGVSIKEAKLLLTAAKE